MFRIAFVPGVTLTKWTRAWAQRRPDVALQVTPAREPDQVAVLLAREADVSFVRLPIDADGLNVIRLYSETAVVVVPKEHPLTALDAVTLADLTEFGGENRLEVDERDANGVRTAVELVAANAGVLVLPQSVARLHSRKDVTAFPITDAPETEIAMAWLAGETTDDIDEFVGIVRGRTERSSRATPTPPPDKSAKSAKKGSPGKGGGTDAKGGSAKGGSAKGGSAKMSRASGKAASLARKQRARDAANARKRRGKR